MKFVHEENKGAYSNVVKVGLLEPVYGNSDTSLEFNIGE